MIKGDLLAIEEVTASRHQDSKDEMIIKAHTVKKMELQKNYLVLKKNLVVTKKTLLENLLKNFKELNPWYS
jgi:uncharacterized protein YktB (UPF0637 family)